jgi:type IV pilus assembly protein PilX
MSRGAYSYRHQRGIVLAVGLIFLLVLTVIGLTAIRTTALDETMAGNARDRNLAFQAAEAALRDAERDVANSVASHSRDISGLTGFSTDCGASTTANTADDGLCYNGPTGFAAEVWTTNSMTAPPSVPYGRFTGATALANVSAQPRYLIEGLIRHPSGESGPKFLYRITVQATGANPNTVVRLQSVFKP